MLFFFKKKSSFLFNTFRPKKNNKFSSKQYVSFICHQKKNDIKRVVCINSFMDLQSTCFFTFLFFLKKINYILLKVRSSKCPSLEILKIQTITFFFKKVLISIFTDSKVCVLFTLDKLLEHFYNSLSYKNVLFSQFIYFRQQSPLVILLELDRFTMVSIFFLNYFISML